MDLGGHGAGGQEEGDIKGKGVFDHSPKYNHKRGSGG